MLPNFPDFSLSLEQKFALQKYVHLAKEIPRHELESLLIQVIRIDMFHENLAKGLIKQCFLAEAVPESFDTT